MRLGVAADRASYPIARDKLKARGIEVVALNPVGSGYNAIADERTDIIIERWLLFAEAVHVAMSLCGAEIA
ncbi:MAG: hypothetical protein WBW74_08065 [Xanthobacteraceae bacterium]